LALAVSAAAGCYAPLRSPGVRARDLSDEFRTPRRTAGQPLNFADLTLPAPRDYLLGAGDLLDVNIHGLYPNTETRPVRVQVLANGDVHLPLVGAVRLGGRNLAEAHQAVVQAYAAGFIRDPRANVVLVEKASSSVLVLGEVASPGAYRLPKYENDVAHAIAAAGGLKDDAADVIEVHHRTALALVPCMPEFPSSGPSGPHPALPSDWPAEPLPQVPRSPTPAHPGTPVQADYRAVPSGGAVLLAQLMPIDDGTAELPALAGRARSARLPDLPPAGASPRILRIPLRGRPSMPLCPETIGLEPGDVVVVPSRKNEVFYVVGRLNSTNFVRFSVSARERDLGTGFLLPREREIDVVTAVVMAGYIDPIDSPTTVTVQRQQPDGAPLLIHVDLIKARRDPKETVLVRAGDIIYLNPDLAWWNRYNFDRIIGTVLTTPYQRWVNGR
jgi:protein involved in polysaccharide export with SLBB domain